MRLADGDTVNIVEGFKRWVQIEKEIHEHFQDSSHRSKQLFTDHVLCTYQYSTTRTYSSRKFISIK